MSQPTLWLNTAALDAMVAAAEQAAPEETGGMLLGWGNHDRNEIVVTTVIGPGPNASHSRTGFRPDSEWQQERLDTHYEKSEGRITYLGDWHVHPQGGFGLSRRDRRTMARTARETDARCPQPLMGLLAWAEDAYHVGVWRWVPGRWRLLGLGTATALTLRDWTPTAEEGRWLP